MRRENINYEQNYQMAHTIEINGNIDDSIKIKKLDYD